MGPWNGRDLTETIDQFFLSEIKGLGGEPSEWCAGDQQMSPSLFPAPCSVTSGGNFTLVRMDPAEISKYLKPWLFYF